MAPLRSRRLLWSAITLALCASVIFSPSACGDRTGRRDRAKGNEPAPGVGDEKGGDRVAVDPPGENADQDPGESIACAVVRVVDGDTIRVEFNGKLESVRYIGIDTPETVHPSKPVQPFGPEASTFNKELLTSGQVELAFDFEQRDHYGRLLAYVYTVYDNRRVLVNLELVRAGLARAYPYPPNVSRAELFREAEKEAQEAHRGLWSAEDEPK